LRHHSGDATIKQLQVFAIDSEPSVAAIALARLEELDPKLVVPSLDAVLGNPDAKVRGFGVEVLFRLPSEAYIGRLADRLSDLHPAVRSQARQALRQLAERPEWRDDAIRESKRVLAATDWRGLEQAAILLAQLDQKQAARRLIEVLSVDRPEAFVAAAWALRKLAVPDSLPAALKYFGDTFAVGPIAGSRKVPAEAVDRQLCQLAQLFGQVRYRPADSVLRSLIPPTQKAGPEARAAAAWALGLIHEGKSVPEIVELLTWRLSAISPMDMEHTHVRRMCAVTLGRMKSTEAIPTLRRFYRDKRQSMDVVNNACGWAIEQMTGERVPEMTLEMPQRDWFLIPNK